MSTFAVGARVGWTLKNGEKGTGTVVMSCMDEGHSLVAVDPIDPKNYPGRTFAQSTLEFHPVICCTNTWLSPLAELKP